MYYNQESVEPSWGIIKEKFKQWAEYLGLTEFKGSNGWVNSILKRHNVERINLQGEGDDMSED